MKIFKAVFIFLGLFLFFIVPVKAYTFEEYTRDFQVAQSSCNDNLFYQSIFAGAYINPSNNYYQASNEYSTSYLIPVEPSTLYTLSVGTRFYLYFFDTSTSNPQYINSYSTTSSFGTSSTTAYIAIMIKTVPSTVPSSNGTVIKLYKGSTVPNDGVLPDYSCHSNPSPDGPNTLYSDFIDLYINKFSDLVSFASTNSYFIIAISIIFAWCVLELTFKFLHIRGGKK